MELNVLLGFVVIVLFMAATVTKARLLWSLFVASLLIWLGFVLAGTM
jgi:hypothetical protein